MSTFASWAPSFIGPEKCESSGGCSSLYFLKVKRGAAPLPLFSSSKTTSCSAPPLLPTNFNGVVELNRSSITSTQLFNRRSVVASTGLPVSPQSFDFNQVLPSLRAYSSPSPL